MKRALKMLRWKLRRDPDQVWMRPPPHEAMGWRIGERERMDALRDSGEWRRVLGQGGGLWPWCNPGRAGDGTMKAALEFWDEGPGAANAFEACRPPAAWQQAMDEWRKSDDA